MITSDIASGINQAAQTINQPRTLEETLQTLVEAARDSMPGFDQVGISTVDRRGSVRTEAATGDLVYSLDKIQYDLGEGPSVETLREASMVQAPHTPYDQRWPRYVPQAAEYGLRSQLAVRLYIDEEGTVGAISYYSTTSDDIDPEAPAIGYLFAAHAAIALEHAQEREDLNAALHSRKVIGQGIGIVMERYGLTEDAAFAFLLRASGHRNISLRDIANHLVDDGNHW